MGMPPCLLYMLQYGNAPVSIMYVMLAADLKFKLHSNVLFQVCGIITRSAFNPARVTLSCVISPV